MNDLKVFGDKILVKISNEEREKLFKKKIRRDDGTEVELFINVPATDHADERTHSLFVNTGIVMGVGDDVEGIKVGDIAILDFQVSNLISNFVYKDGDDDVFWINATTTYHTSDMVAYANRRSPKDQIVHKRGDYDELSMLLGVVRGDKFYAREPYVFLNHESNSVTMVGAGGIIYTQTDKILKRSILSVSDQTALKFRVSNGDTIAVDDRDVFDINLNGKKITAVNDQDMLYVEREDSIGILK